jgi:hypothetical protein
LKHVSDSSNENVWVSQKMMGLLYDVETHTANYHLKKILADGDLQEDSVIRNFRITAAADKVYDTRQYNFPVAIAVGHKVNSDVQDRLFESDFDRMIKALPADGDQP